MHATILCLLSGRMWSEARSGNSGPYRGNGAQLQIPAGGGVVKKDSGKPLRRVVAVRRRASFRSMCAAFAEAAHTCAPITVSSDSFDVVELSWSSLTTSPPLFPPLLQVSRSRNLLACERPWCRKVSQ